jgi:hypothetical protein
MSAARRPTWPTCPVCGERHRPARFTNGGPGRCYHCGRTARDCACYPDLLATLAGWFTTRPLAGVGILAAVAILAIAVDVGAPARPWIRFVADVLPILLCVALLVLLRRRIS